jgi:hypothetical protein
VKVAGYTDSFCEDLDDEEEDDKVKWRERERERERGREARKKFPGRVGIAVFKLSKCSQKEKLIF